MTEADVDATMAVDATTTDVAVITDADAAEMDGDFLPLEIIPAAIFSGSSFCYASVMETDAAMAADATAITATAAGSSLYCFFCAATAVAADADQISRQRVISSAFFYTAVFFFLPLFASFSHIPGQFRKKHFLLLQLFLFSHPFSFSFPFIFIFRRIFTILFAAWPTALQLMLYYMSGHPCPSYSDNKNHNLKRDESWNRNLSPRHLWIKW